MSKSVNLYLRTETRYSENSFEIKKLKTLRISDKIRKSEKKMQENQDDREIRIRKETAKGQEFRIQLLEDQRIPAQRAWRKQLNKVENVLADSGDRAKEFCWKRRWKSLLKPTNASTKRSKTILVRNMWRRRNLRFGKKNTQTC